MSLLSLILFGDQNKPQPTTGVSNAVATQRQNEKNAELDRSRNAQKQAWHEAIYGQTPSDPVGKAITDTNLARQKVAMELGLSSGEEDYTGYGGGNDYGADSGASVDSEADKAVSSMTEAEKKAILNMKNSNVPYSYPVNENDLMYMAASEKRNEYWGFKEEIFLYTIHDRQKHKYITSVQIDSDKNDIVSSCQIEMPYNSKLMEYWIPGKTAFMVMGGVFDREVLFIGRVSEVNQLGDTISVVGQNIGWKFKQYMSDEFFKKIQTLPVEMVVKAIFQELKFTEGKYHIDLSGIPNLDKYILDENATIQYDGDTVYNVPDLTEVVSRMKDIDISKYVASKSNIRETKTVGKDYNKKVQMTSLDAVIGATNSYTPSTYRKNFGVSTTLDKDGKLQYDPLMDRIYGSNKKVEYFTEDKSGDGEHTYEDILHNIASAIDAHFYIVDTTVCFVSFNSLMAMGTSQAIHKAIQPTIEFWQLMDDSYELNVNQYGFYNTVIIKYKNGTLKRGYDDLIRIYGEVPITYKEPDLNYEAAQLKAQAYLAAHVRDFGMEITASILYSGKITVSSFIKLLNPLTMSETLLYVFGMSINWTADNQTLICDLDLRFGPENPDNPEVPETGMQYNMGAGSSYATYSGDVSANVSEAAKQITSGCTTPDQKAYAIYDWVDRNVTYKFYTGRGSSSEGVLKSKVANCYDTAYLIYDLCSAAGVKCKVYNGTYHFLDSTYGHLWNEIEYQGKMVFADTGRDNRNPLGQHGNGRYIVSQTCVAQNY